MLPVFGDSRLKIAKVLTNFTEKPVKAFEISLEKMIWGNNYGSIANFGFKSEQRPKIC